MTTRGAGIGDDFDGQRFGKIRHESARPARRPVQLHRMIWCHLAAEGLACGGERDVFTGLADERDVAQRDGGAASNRQHAATRQMQRLTDQAAIPGVRPR